MTMTDDKAPNLRGVDTCWNCGFMRMIGISSSCSLFRDERGFFQKANPNTVCDKHDSNQAG